MINILKITRNCNALPVDTLTYILFQTYIHCQRLNKSKRYHSYVNLHNNVIILIYMIVEHDSSNVSKLFINSWTGDQVQ